MIVKNEEKHLKRCLTSVSDVADELIIVDTGSTDSTIKIAEEFGAQILHYEWNNNFAEARNYALSKCTKNWILYLDADEYLAEDSIPKIKILKNSSPTKAFYCKIVNEDKTNNRPSIMLYPRLFPNIKRLKFTGAVHEQIETSLAALKIPVLNSELVIIHTGYDISDTDKKKKAQRNLEILLEDYKKNPDSYTAFQMAQSYGVLGDKASAENYFTISLQDKSLRKEYRSLAYRYLGLNIAERNDFAKAKEYLNFSLGIDKYQPLTLMGLYEVEKKEGNFSESANYLKQAFIINKEFSEGKRSSFQSICVNEELFYLAAIELILISGNVLLLNYFIPSLPVKYKEFFFEISYLIKGESIHEKLALTVKENFSASIIPVLLGKYFKAINKTDISVFYFEIAIINGTADAQVYLFLIADLLTINRIEEALIYADKAYRLYQNNPQLSEIFSKIITRIKTGR